MSKKFIAICNTAEAATEGHTLLPTPPKQLSSVMVPVPKHLQLIQATTFAHLFFLVSTSSIKPFFSQHQCNSPLWFYHHATQVSDFK